MPDSKPRPDKTFTQKEIESMLHQQGLSFDTLGHIDGPLTYASLRAPQRAGIYYLDHGASAPYKLSDSLILVPKAPDEPETNAYIILDNPQLAFYKLMRASYPSPSEFGIHPTAIIDPTASVAKTAHIGAYCVIEATTEIGENCWLDSHVVVKSGVTISHNTRIESHCTIGATGVAWIWDEKNHERVMQPQTGAVKIGSNVFLGSDVTIVRGSVNEATEIGNDTVIAHGSKIGHGCRIGQQCHLANNISLAGNVDTGNEVFFGSAASVRPRVTIAAGVVVGTGAVVIKDIHTPGAVVAGVPAKVIGQRTAHTKLAGVPHSSSR